MFILRGAPASGKSTWIRESGLGPYTISSDAVRLLLSTPVYDADGNLCISQDRNSETWQLINKTIQERMRRGETVILDATSLKSDDMRAYKGMAQDNRYIVYVVDFTGVPEETCLVRNAARPEPARVPDYVIEGFYAQVESQEVPNGYHVVTPQEALDIFRSCDPLDLTDYCAVNFFGDIHGCQTALSKALLALGCTLGDDGMPALRDDEFYVFCGDYINRGIENAAVMEYLMSIIDRKNVMMLEGNHEKYLDAWAHGKEMRSDVFAEKTAPELEAAGVDKKKVSAFMRRLIPCAWLKCPGNSLVFACHGGVPTLPDPYMGISCAQLVKGVGSFREADDVNASWEMTSGAEGIYLVHGHRSGKVSDAHPFDHVFSLEGAVEHGGELRVARFDSIAAPRTIAIDNDVFERVSMNVRLEDVSFEDAVENLRANPMVREKDLGHGVSSFNFTREAFQRNAWDAQSIKARGLFLDLSNGYILARSYDKFFNVGEQRDIEDIAASFTYPVSAYQKENGYLGICAPEGNGKLFFASKSTNRGEYASQFKTLALRTLGGNASKFADYLEDIDASAVFEVIAPAFDRHIIEYDKPKIVLLDIIYNDFAYEHIDYEELCDVAARFKLDVKKLIRQFDTKRQLIEWYAEVSAVGYVPEDGVQVEGYVLVDANDEMAKVKCDYYRYWKTIRGMIHDVMKRDRSARVENLIVQHPEVEGFYAWLKRYIYDWRRSGHADEDPAVIDVRNAWEAEQGN